MHKYSVKDLHNDIVLRRQIDLTRGYPRVPQTKSGPKGR